MNSTLTEFSARISSFASRPFLSAQEFFSTALIVIGKPGWIGRGVKPFRDENDEMNRCSEIGTV